MNNVERIVDNLIRQSDPLYAVGIRPSRFILGIEIVKILKLYCIDSFIYQSSSNNDFLFMGLPVTIDYENKWILMVCAGNECSGEFWLDKNEKI